MRSGGKDTTVSVRRGSRVSAALSCGTAEGTEVAGMSVGQSSALIVIGTVLRFVLTWPPRHVSVPVIGIVYINFQEFGVILMAGGAVSVAVWLALMATRAPR
jgi:hypothetical protein